MKKLFFFRSSTPDKQVNVENSPNKEGNQAKKRDEYSSGSFRASLFKSQNQKLENQGLDTGACLRRSRSFSSASFMGNATAQMNFSGLSDPSSSPCSSNSSVNAQEHIQSSRGRTLTPERHVKARRSTRSRLENNYVGEKPLSSRSSRLYVDASDNSSLSSSNVSNEALDLYIDGEQHHERRPKHGGGKKPPKIKCTPLPSSTGSFNDTPRAPSSRGNIVSEPPSNRWVETRVGHESPKELANVVEKLCLTHSGTSARNFDTDVPITIDDVYGRSPNKKATSKSHTAFRGDFGVDTEDKLDVELKSKFQEMKDKILFLSQELARESFLNGIEFNVPSLVRRVKDLTEEKKNLALECLSSLESQLDDRAFMKAKIRSLSIELESKTRKLQEEKKNIQSEMDKEWDRRSNDWLLKVEAFQTEEMRLRERVRELAEQNVSLQREVSSLSVVKSDRQHMEKQVNDLTVTLEASRDENQDLRKSICELEDKCRVADEGLVYVQTNYREKEEECGDLHACVTRLVRTCNDQEKTIDTLRGELAELLQKKHPTENSDWHIHKLQLEQIRLTGVEQVLRREIESYKTEVEPLRRENIYLLNRLRVGNEGGLLTLKLDEELSDRLDLLQKEGLSLVNENTSLCAKLLESLKRVTRNTGNESTEVDRSLDGQFIMESDMKVQGFRRKTEILMRGLKNISTILGEKSDISFSNPQTNSMKNNASGLQNGSNSQDLTRSELKAEVLLTSLFREKLYANGLEIEQLQAEVATSARGIDILKCEVQNARDSLSAVTHRMKELELQMIKKEEKIHQVQSDLQETTRELMVMRGILPKVTEERDMMWEDVKHHSENNMLLNSELNMLKKKIETLEEELLFKEGETTILRDTFGNKSFDLLASPDRTREFR